MRLAIHFDGDSGNIFYAGQVVTGHVQLQVLELTKIRGVRLHVTGKAKTSWQESHTDHHNDSHDTHTERYSGKEEYMNFEICLIGSKTQDSVVNLKPSVNKYPFSFLLPPELPESFEDKFGRIRYKAKAKVNRPMTIDDKVKVPFTVHHLLDLNREPLHLRAPLVLHQQAESIECCCANGFTEINATINRGCFVPGETMSIDGEIVNRTNSTIRYSKIALLQVIEYFATNRKGRVCRTKCSPTTLAKVHRPLLESGHTDSWSNSSVVIPPVFSSRLDGCGIIDIRYSVEISAVFDGFVKRSSFSRPIVIGNIPLQDNFQPSVVTSQPMLYPATRNMASGYMPPANVQHIGFNTPGFPTPNYNGNNLPEVHRM